MRVCVFGNCRKEYNRNRVFFKCLNKLNYDIVERFIERFSFIGFFKIFFSTLFFTKFDVMLILYPGAAYILPARIICSIRRKPLIFDFLIYVYETEIEYGSWKPDEFKAKFSRFIEKLNCKLADKVIFDNPQKVIFFSKEFGLKEEKCHVVPIGADESLFYPRKKPANRKFMVLWYGNVMPNQGFEFICEAAKKLEDHKDIHFTFIGANWRFREAKEKYSALKNITFLDSIPYANLVKYISKADLCLGQFGNSIKARKGLANKMFECIAMQKPYITVKTPAMENYFSDKKNLLFVEGENASAIVNAILELKKDKVLRNKIAKGGRKVFVTNFSEQVIKERLKDLFNIL